MTKAKEYLDFRDEFALLVDKHRVKRGRTDDSIVADFLAECLVAFDKAADALYEDNPPAGG